MSDDGVAWRRRNQADQVRFDYGPRLLASGHAGVIGISDTAKAEQSAVWELR